MKLLRKVFAWFNRYTMDHRLERYLAQSVDLYDLERREQRWNFMSEAERNNLGR